LKLKTSFKVAFGAAEIAIPAAKFAALAMNPESLCHCKRVALAPVPAGLANPAPARRCVGRWHFAPVLASGQTLRSATMQPATNPNGIEIIQSKVARERYLGCAFHKCFYPERVVSFAASG
jgi:hypothetical protein